MNDLEGFCPADLAHTHPIRTHAQGTPDQVALADAAHAFAVLRPALQHDPIGQGGHRRQLVRILDRDHSVSSGDAGQQHIGQRGLAAAEAARDQDVAVGRDAA